MTQVPAVASVAEQRLGALAARRTADLQLTMPATAWDADGCPPEWLPVLAWALHVDVWDSSWPVDRMRGAIREAVELHRAHGTESAMRTVLERLGAVYTYEEPGFGEATVSVANLLGIGLETAAMLRGELDRVKRASVHLTLQARAGHMGKLPLSAGWAARRAWRGLDVPGAVPVTTAGATRLAASADVTLTRVEFGSGRRADANVDDSGRTDLRAAPRVAAAAVGGAQLVGGYLALAATLDSAQQVDVTEIGVWGRAAGDGADVLVAYKARAAGESPYVRLVGGEPLLAAGLVDLRSARAGVSAASAGVAHSGAGDFAHLSDTVAPSAANRRRPLRVNAAATGIEAS